tara:strand:- start:1527 stop:1985 length:459 start_codon:yes stop_codon:yes gene_type:complete
MAEGKTRSGCGGVVLGVVITLGAIVVGFVACVGMVGTSYVEQEKESAGKAAIKDTSWVPDGFTAYNNNVAIKWSDSGTYSCSYGDRCIQMEVVSKNGCDSLYGELTKLDSNGNNIGYTNETTSNLQPGQKAILMFNTYGDVSKFNLSKISCY